jgi:hypothetical protein
MLSVAISHLFPSIDFTTECILVDDGTGPYIAAWNRPEPQPTPEEIEAAILPAKRAQVIEQINAERDRREQSTFPYLGKQVDSDPVSVQRITVASSTAQMALAASVPFEVNWACADNSLLTLDAMGVLGMMQALGSHGLALHMYGRGLKAQAEASEEPESIDILTGWPE